MNIITRRKALLAIIKITAATSLISCGYLDKKEGSAQIKTINVENSDLETLASMAYDLFPHKSLPPTLYADVAKSVLALKTSTVEEGLARLYQLANNKRWIELDEAERINLLTTLEDSEFFALMRATTIDVLYKTPEMFELVGYGGSAIEKGGYLFRGFDDISWLPATEEK